ncbi:hypothetical protein AAG570_004673 [Ranatra chinensis]|uniref:PIN domain-containing protein n=1 Tax=Ranatra chinensis TaxID=642074 RepID=A0ABD0Y1J0_9HEMI
MPEDQGSIPRENSVWKLIEVDPQPRASEYYRYLRDVTYSDGEVLSDPRLREDSDNMPNSKKRGASGYRGAGSNINRRGQGHQDAGPNLSRRGRGRGNNERTMTMFNAPRTAVSEEDSDSQSQNSREGDCDDLGDDWEETEIVPANFAITVGREGVRSVFGRDVKREEVGDQKPKLKSALKTKWNKPYEDQDPSGVEESGGANGSPSGEGPDSSLLFPRPPERRMENRCLAQKRLERILNPNKSPVAGPTTSSEKKPMPVMSTETDEDALIVLDNLKKSLRNINSLNRPCDKEKDAVRSEPHLNRGQESGDTRRRVVSGISPQESREALNRPSGSWTQRGVISSTTESKPATRRPSYDNMTQLSDCDSTGSPQESREVWKRPSGSSNQRGVVSCTKELKSPTSRPSYDNMTQPSTSNSRDSPQESREVWNRPSGSPNQTGIVSRTKQFTSPTSRPYNNMAQPSASNSRDSPQESRDVWNRPSGSLNQRGFASCIKELKSPTSQTSYDNMAQPSASNSRGSPQESREVWNRPSGSPNQTGIVSRTKQLTSPTSRPYNNMAQPSASNSRDSPQESRDVWNRPSGSLNQTGIVSRTKQLTSPTSRSYDNTAQPSASNSRGSPQESREVWNRPSGSLNQRGFASCIKELKSPTSRPSYDNVTRPSTSNSRGSPRESNEVWDRPSVQRGVSSQPVSESLSRNLYKRKSVECVSDEETKRVRLSTKEEKGHRVALASHTKELKSPTSRPSYDNLPQPSTSNSGGSPRESREVWNRPSGSSTQRGAVSQPVSESLSRNLYKRKSTEYGPSGEGKRVQVSPKGEQSLRAALGSSTKGLKLATSRSSRNSPQQPSTSNSGESSTQIDVNLSGVEDEAMDWEPLSEEHLMTELQTVRYNLVVEDHYSVNGFNFSKCMTSVDERHETSTDSVLYVVIDTNVLISNLPLVDSLLTEKVGDFKPIIAIPWQVLKELDYLKEGNVGSSDKSAGQVKTVAKSARAATAFLLENSESIYCQSQKDSQMDNDYFDVEVPDDNIIKCCMKIQKKGHCVVLLSNDRNLCLKCTTTDVLGVSEQRFKDYMGKNRKARARIDVEKVPCKEKVCDYELCMIIHQLAMTLKSFLYSVIERGLSEKYGGMWTWHASFKPPWSLIEVITCAHLQWAIITSVKDVRKPVSCLKIIQNYFINVKYEEPLAESELEIVLKECHTLVSTLPEAFRYLTKSLSEQIEVFRATWRERKKLISVARVKRVVNCFQLVENISKYYCKMTPDNCNNEVSIVQGMDSFGVAADRLPPVLDLVGTLHSISVLLGKLHDLLNTPQGYHLQANLEKLTGPTRDCLVRFCSKVDPESSSLTQEDVLEFFNDCTIRGFILFGPPGFYNSALRLNCLFSLNIERSLNEEVEFLKSYKPLLLNHNCAQAQTIPKWPGWCGG